MDGDKLGVSEGTREGNPLGAVDGPKDGSKLGAEVGNSSPGTIICSGVGLLLGSAETLGTSL